MATECAFGEWESVITSDLLTVAAVRLTELEMKDKVVFWTEGRPDEGGRSALVAQSLEAGGAGPVDIVPRDVTVGTRVHEYGGAPFIVASDLRVFYSETKTGCIFRIDLLDRATLQYSEPVALTAESKRRFADFALDESRGVLYAVCEDHSEGGHEPVASIVAIDVRELREIRTVYQGDDFYAAPRVHAASNHFCFLAWKHPAMPFFSTSLYVGKLQEDGTLAEVQQLAGEAGESVLQPLWIDEDTLLYVSDKGEQGYWNPHVHTLSTNTSVNICPSAREFAEPAWLFDRRMVAVQDAEHIVAAFVEKGFYALSRINIRTHTVEVVDSPFTVVGKVTFDSGFLALLGENSMTPRSVVVRNLAAGGADDWKVLRASCSVSVDAGYISVPEPINDVPSGDGVAHALFYRPKNPRFSCSTQKPPLLVKTHGGPTAASAPGLSFVIQYFTSRGWAVCDLNYRGSTGYGRQHRMAAHGRWGVVDVEDCVSIVNWLVDHGEVDRERVCVDGASAGGYTTLACLTFAPSTFAAGTSYYGISDLVLLAQDTHKFEARYLDTLIGPYPEGRQLYVDRSPITHVAAIKAPTLLLQGLDDKVVPPNQARLISESLNERGVPVALVEFEGEGHGFRKASSIRESLEAENTFYAKVFGFRLPDADRLFCPPIKNLDK